MFKYSRSNFVKRDLYHISAGEFKPNLQSVLICRAARGMFGCRGQPGSWHSFFLLAQKNEAKEKGTPLHQPFGQTSADRKNRAAAQLATA
jgi:hypothetical protein